MTLYAGETLERFQPHFELLFGSNGDLIGIQNPRANGADLRFSSDGTETIGTLNVTSSFNLYNTSPISATDYERLRMDWSSNVARIWTQNDGTGSGRALRVGAGQLDGGTAPFSYTTWQATAVPVIQHSLQGGAGTGTFHELGSTIAALSASSGTQTAVAISPTFAQTSTAAGIALLVNPSGTFGSGGGKLQSWQLASSEVGAMTSSGAMYAGSFRTLLDFGFAATVGGSTDLTLIRDAADTLAQRRTTNAQTFRVYNTYTDASNYERLAMVWSGSNAFLLVENAGTGSARDLTVGTGGSANFNIRTANTGRWQVNPSGHFLAVTDNTYDIGASGATRPRNLYVGSSVIVGLNASIDGVANIGIAQSSSTTLNIAPSITTRSSLRLTAGVAPTSPVDGDMWRVGAQLFLRDGGTTKSVTFA